jgi:opacity protein-like surface antigen
VRILARALFVATVLGAGWASSPAQVVPAAVGPGAYVAVGAGLSGFQAVYGQRDLAGGFIYADVHPQWRVGFEGEARFLRLHTSEDVTESNYIGGIRVLMLRSHGLEPYTKFLAGMGKITLPFGDAHGSFLAYAPGAGLDVALNHNVTVRAIDFEYQHWPQFPYGSFSPYGISSGIRVRVTPIARIPQGVRKRRLRFSRGTLHSDPPAG